MALEMKFIKKKEGRHMPKHTLVERTHVYVDPKTGESRLADLKKDKDSIFLLGAEGTEIELERAQELGLVKSPKSKDSDKE